MSVQVNRIETIDVANTLGEGVLWRASDSTIWWTDIEESVCLSWHSLELEHYETPERVGSFTFIEG